MIYLSNAFSLNMLELRSQAICVEIQPVLPGDVPLEAVSIIGHEDTASLVSHILGRNCPVNRDTVLLTVDDLLFVAQYHGQRLAEGATQLPQDAQLEFYRITIKLA